MRNIAAQLNQLAMGKSSNSALVILAFFAIYVIWGSTYLLNKIAVLELEPFMLAGCRFTEAGLCIFLLAKIMGISLSITKNNSGIPSLRAYFF